MPVRIILCCSLCENRLPAACGLNDIDIPDALRTLGWSHDRGYFFCPDHPGRTALDMERIARMDLETLDSTRSPK